MTIICYFTAISQQTKKAVTTNKCASAMGHFDGHDDAPVRCRVHHPIKHVHASLEATGRRHRAIICPVLP